GLGEMDFTEREVRKYSLQEGDVLVCEGGEPGRAAVWQGQRPDVLYQKALHRVRLDPSRMLPAFLVYQLWALASSGRLAERFTGSTIAHLPREDMLALSVVVPSLSDQTVVVEAIERELSMIEALSASTQSTVLRAQELRQAILSQAFEGRLVSQGSGAGAEDFLPSTRLRPAKKSLRGGPLSGRR